MTVSHTIQGDESIFLCHLVFSTVNCHLTSPVLLHIQENTPPSHHTYIYLSLLIGFDFIAGTNLFAPFQEKSLYDAGYITGNLFLSFG